MSDLKERLKSKGWSDDDINHAMDIIAKAQAKKSEKIRFLDSIVYWVVLVFALIGNFIISIILIPFMLAMQGIRLVFIIGIIGFAFGAFFDLIINDLRNIENKQVIIAGVFLPLLALINVSLMVEFANYLQGTLKLVNAQHNPWVISIAYVFAFMLPHFIKRFMSMMTNKRISTNVQKF
jgi:hypothetical protein